MQTIPIFPPAHLGPLASRLCLQCDDEDADTLKRHAWCLCYIFAHTSLHGHVRSAHALLMKADKNARVYFRDNDTFNLCRSNLTLDPAQRPARRPLYWKSAASGLWIVRNRDSVCVGLYETEQGAAAASTDANRMKRPRRGSINTTTADRLRDLEAEVASLKDTLKQLTEKTL